MQDAARLVRLDTEIDALRRENEGFQREVEEEEEVIALLREELIDAQAATADAETRWEAVNEHNEQLQRDLVAMAASSGQVRKENVAMIGEIAEIRAARDAAVAMAVQQARDEAAQALEAQREALVGIGALPLPHHSSNPYLSLSSKANQYSIQPYFTLP